MVDRRGTDPSQCVQQKVDEVEHPHGSRSGAECPLPAPSMEAHLGESSARPPLLLDHIGDVAWLKTTPSGTHYPSAGHSRRCGNDTRLVQRSPEPERPVLHRGVVRFMPSTEAELHLGTGPVAAVPDDDVGLHQTRRRSGSRRWPRPRSTCGAWRSRPPFRSPSKGTMTPPGYSTPARHHLGAGCEQRSCSGVASAAVVAMLVYIEGILRTRRPRRTEFCQEADVSG